MRTFSDSLVYLVLGVFCAWGSLHVATRIREEWIALGYVDGGTYEEHRVTEKHTGMGRKGRTMFLIQLEPRQSAEPWSPSLIERWHAYWRGTDPVDESLEVQVSPARFAEIIVDEKITLMRRSNGELEDVAHGSTFGDTWFVEIFVVLVFGGASAALFYGFAYGLRPKSTASITQ